MDIISELHKLENLVVKDLHAMLDQSSRRNLGIWFQTLVIPTAVGSNFVGSFPLLENEDFDV